MSLNEIFDFIIVGGGSAGCVVAYNLSQAGFTVALIEAGGRNSLARNSDLPFMYQSPDEWSFETSKENHPFTRKPCGYCNRMLAFRGDPAVYEKWADLTNDPSWRYEKLVPIFQSIEKFYPRRNGATSGGQKGWLSISHAESELFELEIMDTLMKDFNIPFQKDVLEANRTGVGFWNFIIPDHGSHRSYLLFGGKKRSNHEESDGVDHRRLSSIENHDHLKKNVRIFDHTVCIEVVCRVDNDRQVSGVSVLQGEGLYKADNKKRARSTGNPKPTKIFCRHEVILCGGAINSPQLLMLSGIGDKTHLESLGIACRHDNPEVGRNLMDHAQLRVTYELSHIKHRWQVGYTTHFNNPQFCNFEGWDMGSLKAPFTSMGFHYKTESGYNLQIGIYTKAFESTCDDDDKKTFGSFLIQYSSTSSDGSIRLRSRDPLETPLIDEKMDNDENATAVAEGLMFVRKIMKQHDEWHPKEVSPALDNDDDFESIKKYFKEKSAVGEHMSGTCSMMKVVDSEGIVYGVKGLRIIDTSIFPLIVSSNPVLPVYMMAEKLSRLVIEKYR